MGRAAQLSSWCGRAVLNLCQLESITQPPATVSSQMPGNNNTHLSGLLRLKWDKPIKCQRSIWHSVQWPPGEGLGTTFLPVLRPGLHLAALPPGYRTLTSHSPCLCLGPKLGSGILSLDGAVVRNSRIKHVRHFNSIWCTVLALIFVISLVEKCFLWESSGGAEHSTRGPGGCLQWTLPFQGSRPPSCFIWRDSQYLQVVYGEPIPCIRKGSRDPELSEPLLVRVAVIAVTPVPPFASDEQWTCVGSWCQPRAV